MLLKSGGEALETDDILSALLPLVLVGVVVGAGGSAVLLSVNFGSKGHAGKGSDDKRLEHCSWKKIINEIQLDPTL